MICPEIHYAFTHIIRVVSSPRKGGSNVKLGVLVVPYHDKCDLRPPFRVKFCFSDPNWMTAETQTNSKDFWFHVCIFILLPFNVNLKQKKKTREKKERKLFKLWPEPPGIRRQLSLPTWQNSSFTCNFPQFCHVGINIIGSHHS